MSTLAEHFCTRSFFSINHHLLDGKKLRVQKISAKVDISLHKNYFSSGADSHTTDKYSSTKDLVSAE